MKKKKGLTLVEVMIYVAILGLVATALMSISINIMSIRSKAFAQRELNANLRFISQKINHEIRNAKSIGTVGASSLTLNLTDSSRNPTQFDLNGGNLRMGVGSAGSCPTSSPCKLNSNYVTITGFNVTNLSTGDSKTQNIKYTLSGSFVNGNNRIEFKANGTINDSIELRSR